VNKVVLEMTLEEASSVILALIEAQKGYTDGPAIPERILNLRQIITNLDKSMEDYVNNK
jgi:hypothetical protein